ncbi:MAG: phospholipid carrier-dependent glycosyltransferase [Candidatus Omnitrophica bacterium]|nr:phospholipid carrier-dependent glycosyltransferase [Candidatus Omnitrophota bacterium]
MISMSGKDNTRLILFLVAVFAILSLYTWKPKICFNPDELFYYKSTQSIREVKDLYAPEYFGERRFQKPPLFYSAVLLSFKLLGTSWFSARLVSVFSSILVLLATYMLGVRMFGREKAFYATGSLATTVLFFRFGRIVLPEMMLIFFMTASFYLAYTAFSLSKHGYFYASFALMGAGTLVKGPVAFVLPGAALAVFYLVNRRRFTLPTVPWAAGALIVFSAFLVWAVPAVLIYGRQFLDHMATVEMDRFTEKISFGSPWRLFWHYSVKLLFYVPVLFAQYLPWSVLLPAGLVIIRKYPRGKELSLERSFLLCWILAGFVLYTLVPAKRAHYVLSLFPALSLYLVSFFDFGAAIVRKAFRRLLVAALAVYFLTVVMVFPMIFIDGVDRLSMELEKQLKKRRAPVAVSWRLDPQEVELYIDERVIVLWEVNLGRTAKALDPRLEQALSSGGGSGTLFYLVMAQTEYRLYRESFISRLEKVRGKDLSFSRLYGDSFWRKRILFGELLRNILDDPSGAARYFNEAFREKVYLFAVKEN